MYCATGIGPSAAMMRGGSPFPAASLSPRHRAAVAAAVGRSAIDDQHDAERAQRQRQQHAHGQPAPQEAELRVGFAEEFADRARERVADAKAPRTGPAAAARRARISRREHDEQHAGLRASPRRAGSDGAAAGRRVGKTMAHGTSVGAAPQFAIDEVGDRPRNSPIGATAQTMSPSERIGMLR